MEKLDFQLLVDESRGIDALIFVEFPLELLTTWLKREFLR